VLGATLFESLRVYQMRIDTCTVFLILSLFFCKQVYPHRRRQHQHGHSQAPPLFFVDVGANDGVSLSQTMALEAHFGWRGVCVEASDPHFAALQLSRPQCFNAHACLASVPNQTVDFALDHAVLIDNGKGKWGWVGLVCDAIIQLCLCFPCFYETGRAPPFIYVVTARARRRV